MATRTTKTRTPKPKARGQNGKGKELALNEEGLRTLGAIAVRASIAQRLGKSFGDDRDIYEALGYKKSPVYEDYEARYQRQDIAGTLIDKPVKRSWRPQPAVLEVMEGRNPDTEATPFELAWSEVVKRCRVYHHFSRVDRLARIGTSALLLMGVDGGGELAAPLERASMLLYLQPYSYPNFEIESYVADNSDARYGLPETYKIKMKVVGEKDKIDDVLVHHTRVIHVAEDLLEDNVEGIPALRGVLNRLQDLDLVVGGCAEMFWRGAFPGLGFSVDPQASVVGQSLEDLQTEIEKYMHGMQRYLRLQGINISQLSPQVADPSNHVSVILDLISAASGIPKRKLIGSERGELASQEDETTWLELIADRQENHCEPTILRPFIDSGTSVGWLPMPASGEYSVEWPETQTQKPTQAAEIAEKKTNALAKYADSPGADMILPPEMFLRMVLGMTEDQVKEATGALAEATAELNRGLPEEDEVDAE